MLVGVASGSRFTIAGRANLSSPTLRSLEIFYSVRQRLSETQKSVLPQWIGESEPLN